MWVGSQASQSRPTNLSCRGFTGILSLAHPSHWQRSDAAGYCALAMMNGVRSPAPAWIVSIDFGTRGSGFAIRRALAPAGSPPVLHETWPEQPEARYPKDLTAILYKNRTPIAIGWRARNQYLALDRTARQGHTYIESFKLALQDPTRGPALPAWLSVEQAIGDYLSLLRTYAMDVFDDKYGTDPTPPSEDTIHWCLTVPALWSEASKQAMRRAAVRAGLITSLNSPRLTIILEPEAAALHALVHKAPPLTAGMNVMVVDVGGGTTDVTVHTCRNVGGQAVLAEAVSAEGAMVGGVLVDEAFKSYYRQTMGEAAFDTWARGYPREVANVMDKWETIKCAFGSAGSPLSFMIPKPPHLRPSSAAHGTDLTLRSSKITDIFSRPVQAVVDLAVKQAKGTHAAGRSLSMVLLVGGFARSPYLQERVRTALHSHGVNASKVVVPPTPHAAILNGAVVYGASPHLIHARCSKYTYGIKCTVPWTSDAPDQVWEDERKDYYTHSAFSKFVSKGEQVAHNQAVKNRYNPFYHNQKTVGFVLYASENPSIKFIRSDDAQTRQAASVTLTLPSKLPPGCHSARDFRLEAELCFGGTELTIKAWETTSNEPVSTTIKFASM